MLGNDWVCGSLRKTAAQAMRPYSFFVIVKMLQDSSNCSFFGSLSVHLLLLLFQVLTKSLSMVSSQLRSDLNNILFTSQLLFVASTQYVTNSL